MVVKNESANLPDCLSMVLPYVDEAIIADTGSTDGTQDIIRNLTNEEPIRLSLEEENCFSLTPARNKIYGRVKTDWILYLDADERLAPEAGNCLTRGLAAAPFDVEGYFGAWHTEIPGETAFEDYKLFAFRRYLRKRGLAHANVQLDIRSNGGKAVWMDGLEVDHFPDRLNAKRELYWARLQRAMVLEPDWLRHNWFAGYMCFQDGRYAEAHRLFSPLIRSCSNLFPVEGLNARMVSIEMFSRDKNLRAAHDMVKEAVQFAVSVANDFEVKVNSRILPWLAEATRLLHAEELDKVRCYRFSF
jgi:glycosyltransferase involved in cell wall biosynthesis